MNSRRGTPRGEENTVNLRRVMGADDHEGCSLQTACTEDWQCHGLID
jgi:hypothetical protein